MSRIAAACLLSLGLVAPALAQQQDAPSPLDVLIDAFEAPQGQRFIARFVSQPSGSASLIDPIGDFEHSSGQEPGFTPDHIDITSTWALELDPGPIDLFGPTDANRVWAPTGGLEVDPPHFDPFYTFTGDQVHDGSQYADGAVLFGFTLGGTPPPAPPGKCEYVVWVNDLERGPTFVNNPNFPQDPAGGTNMAFGLVLNPDGGPGLQSALALELQEAGGFAPVFEADVRAFITPGYVGITVPRTLVGNLAALNFYSFCVEEDFGFEPEVSGADQTGLMEINIDDFGSVVFESIDVSATTTTVPVPTTATQPQTTTTSMIVGEVPPEEPGGFPWWFVLVAGGLSLAAAGWWLYARGDDPCAELLEAWMTAQRACDETRRKADEAAAECEAAELELAGLEDERKEICKTWPPACWDNEDGDWIADERGNRITSRDIHMRRVALGEVWTDYRAGKLTAGEVEARWREMDTPEFRTEMRDTDAAFAELLATVERDIAEADHRLDQACEEADRARAKADEACRDAMEARRAYEDCVGAEVESTEGVGKPPMRGEQAMAEIGVTAGEKGARGPSTPCRGNEGERVALRAGEPDKTLAFVDFSVITGVSEGSERAGAGRQLAIDLSELAAELDFAGDLLNARSAGLHVGGAINGYAPGKYAVTTAGIVHGGVDATLAASELSPDIPTTPGQAALEGLEALSRLGAIITSKVTDWMENVQLMTVRLTMFYQDITATPYEVWECMPDRGGWVCVERVWEIEISRLKRLLGKDRAFTVNSDIRRQEFRRVIEGLSHRAATTIRRDAESLASWRGEHEPGRCD